MAMGEGGDKKAAEQMMLDFISKYKGATSYHFYEAAEVLGDLAMSRGDYANASKYYGSIITRATKLPEAKLRATLADGRAQMGLKNYDEAKKRFNEVTDSGLNSGNAESLKMMAQVAKASCDAEAGQADAAIKALETIVEKNDPKDAELFARTYVALGKAYEKASKPKDAILAFLAVDLLYFGEADAHAEALAHLSKLWEQVGRADRALTARNTLKDRYAGSVWAP
jgi:tetratricopeptide (TPR) repeat protein